METKETLCQFIEEISKKEKAKFYMPGHKGRKLFEKNYYENILKYDITEIQGADNLFHPKGIIKNLMERYRAYYNVLGSYLLINGSTCGIMASIHATLRRGEKAIVMANCHKSVFNSLSLLGAKVVQVNTDYTEEGISSQASISNIKEAIETHPDSKILVITSPNYYGMTSNVSEIAKVAHAKNMVLIVDQAHGAHLKMVKKFSHHSKWIEDIEDGESYGADLVINSFHKTMASFTQTAVLNLCSNRVNRKRLEKYLEIFQSSSPSYILMSSLEKNIELMEEDENRCLEWIENINFFYEKAREFKKISILKSPFLDRTKINILTDRLSIKGDKLAEILRKSGIETELYSWNLVMALTGIGTTKEDLDYLLKVLREVDNKYGVERKSESFIDNYFIGSWKFKEPIEMNIDLEGEYISVEKSIGRTCLYPIIPYPPGIPLVAMGEKIDEKHIEECKKYSKVGISLMGLDDGRAFVLKEAGHEEGFF